MKLSYRSLAALLVLPLIGAGIACESSSDPADGDAGILGDSSVATDASTGADAKTTNDAATTEKDAAAPKDAAADAQVVSDSGIKDSGKADSGPKTPGEVSAETYCDARCAFVARCAKTESACSNNGASCISGAATIAGSWRDEYTNAFKTCYPALACASPTDACVESGFAVADPTFPNAVYIQDCLAKRTACANGFADDLCLSLAALTDAKRTQAEACKSLACGQVSACLRAAGAFSY